MKNYYTIKFSSGENTTTGEPNARTGRLSIACAITSYTRKRAAVLSGGKLIKFQDIRRYHRGMTIKDFQEYMQEICRSWKSW